MRKLLIIKTGDTFPSISAIQGDFERWIISGINTSQSNCTVIDPRKDTNLPALNEFGAVIVSGSHFMVTDQDAWIKTASEWISRILDKQVPLLGICFGHQLLAYVAGGRVCDNPKGKEFGTVNIYGTAEAKRDRLFQFVKFPFKAHVCHSQTVLEMPKSSLRLAFSALDNLQAFSLGSNAWGVQFHPEFNCFAAQAYIKECREGLSGEGLDPDKLEESCTETPVSQQILQRFGEMFLM